MNYLTNYYKNLSEQLQAQVNNLEYLILEYRRTKTRNVRVDDIENTGEDVPLIHGTVVTKKGNPAGKGAAKTNPVGFFPGMGAMPNYRGDDVADAVEAIADWGRPDAANNALYASMLGRGPAPEVLRGEIFDTERSQKGGSVKGTGQKAKKKAAAIRAANYNKRRG